jgi:hypothetical protein
LLQKVLLEKVVLLLLLLDHEAGLVLQQVGEALLRFGKRVKAEVVLFEKRVQARTVSLLLLLLLVEKLLLL